MPRAGEGDSDLTADGTGTLGPARLLLTIATTEYAHLPDDDQLPDLVEDLERMRALLTHKRFGYTHVPLRDPTTRADASVNPSYEQLRTGLRDFLTSHERRSDDLVVIYYAGHGHLLGPRDYLLALADFDPDKAEGTGVPGTELARWLTANTKVTNLLLILDTCNSGAASPDFAGRVLHQGGASFIVTAARPVQDASPGYLTAALARAVDNPAVAGVRPAMLSIDELVRVINADPAKPGWQTVVTNLLGLVKGQPSFLLNPRHRPEWERSDRLTRHRLEQDDARLHERWSFFDPRARGVHDADDQAWRFTGRHRVLQHLSTWLGELATDRRHRIITADPGSGKSSVIARLCLLADPDRRRQIPDLEALPPGTRPPAGVRICPPIHARGKTAEELLTAIATACDATADSPGQLLEQLGARTEAIVVPIDALDEASQPATVAAGIIRPLLEGDGVLRLVVGTRDQLLPRLGLRFERNEGERVIHDPRGRTVTLDLDCAAYGDQEAKIAYARRCLREINPASPYLTAAPALVDAVAGAVAEAARRSFLVTYLASRTLAHEPPPADPTDPAWRASLPRTAGDAMRHDLDTRLGEQADRVRDLLIPLAYAEGEGLPWSDLWAPLATTISARHYTNPDIERLRHEAGSYIVEAADPASGSVYRLFHESLAQHLRQAHTNDDRTTIHAAFDQVLRVRVPIGQDGRPQWRNADGYTRTHLGTHAAHAATLDTLVTDPNFLLTADHTRLLAALPTVSEPQASLAALAYRLAAPHLRTTHGSERSRYLHLSATQVGAHHLAGQIDSSDLWDWTSCWASWRPHHPHQTLHGHTGGVGSVAVGRVEGRDVIVSGGFDATVRVWDAATGIPLGGPLTGHTGRVESVAVGRVEGRDVIVSGGHDATVRVWDAATGAPVGAPLTGHTGRVRSVAAGRVGGRDVIVSGGHDATVRVWDAATGIPLGGPLTGHTGGVRSVAAGRVEGRDVIVSGGHDATVRVWDAGTGISLGGPLTGHTGGVESVAVGRVEGRDVIVSGGTDTTVRVWDAATGAPLGGPFTGHTGWVESVAVGRVEGRDVIVSGGDDTTVRVWDAATGAPLGGPLTGHSGGVRSVAVGRVEGRDVIVSGGDDATVRVWDGRSWRSRWRRGLRRATPQVVYRLSSAVRGLALPDGVRIVAGAGNQLVFPDRTQKLRRTIDLGGQITAVVAVDQCTVAVGADCGIVVLRLNFLAT